LPRVIILQMCTLRLVITLLLKQEILLQAPPARPNNSNNGQPALLPDMYFGLAARHMNDQGLRIRYASSVQKLPYMIYPQKQTGLSFPVCYDPCRSFALQTTSEHGGLQ
jgi:hypothetical protein